MAGSVGRRKLLLYGLGGATALTGGVIGTSEYLARRHAKLVLHDRPGDIVPGAVVDQRRRLGRTGIDVGVIGIGAGALDGIDPILRAVDKGMTYIDTSRCYGSSE